MAHDGSITSDAYINIRKMDSILENKNLSVDVLIELNKDLAKEVEHQNLAMD